MEWKSPFHREASFGAIVCLCIDRIFLVFSDKRSQIKGLRHQLHTIV